MKIFLDLSATCTIYLSMEKDEKHEYKCTL